MALFFLMKFLNAGKKEVVPSSWYDSDKCYWPPKNQEKLAERFENVKNSCRIFVVKLLSVHSKLSKPAT